MKIGEFWIDPEDLTLVRIQDIFVSDNEDFIEFVYLDSLENDVTTGYNYMTRIEFLQTYEKFHENQ